MNVQKITSTIMFDWWRCACRRKKHPWPINARDTLGSVACLRIRKITIRSALLFLSSFGLFSIIDIKKNTDILMGILTKKEKQRSKFIQQLQCDMTSLYLVLLSPISYLLTFLELIFSFSVLVTASTSSDLDIEKKKRSIYYLNLSKFPPIQN